MQHNKRERHYGDIALLMFIAIKIKNILLNRKEYVNFSIEKILGKANFI